MSTPILSGLSALADKYDGFILDIWGVVHEGGPVFPEVIDCLRELRAADKRVLFLSNAPRRAARVAEILRGKDVGDDMYDGVISSGEATREALRNRQDPRIAALGPAYLALGPDADADLLDGLPYRAAASVDRADFLLAIGPRNRDDGIEAYDPLLGAAAKQGLPMVCANPDRLVVRRGVAEICAGAFAARYEELGGQIHYFGKPHAPVYRLSLAALGAPARRVLAVGDGLETDNAGARAAGIDALLVTGGLLAGSLGLRRTQPPSQEDLDSACARAGVSPVAAITAFAW